MQDIEIVRDILSHAIQHEDEALSQILLAGHRSSHVF